MRKALHYCQSAKSDEKTITRLFLLPVKMSSEYYMDSVLKYNIILLKYIGLWTPERNSALHSIYSAIVFMFFVFPDSLFMLLKMANSFDNLENFSSCLTILSIKVIGCLKWIFFMHNTKIIRSLMQSLHLEEFQGKNIKQKNIMIKSLGSYTTAFMIFFTIGTSSCVMYLFLPILMHQKRLPFDSWYPCQYTESPCYEIVYSHQAISTTLVSLANIGVDNFSAGLMSIIVCQCEILKDSILNISGYCSMEVINSWKYAEQNEASDHDCVDENHYLMFYDDHFRNINSHYINILEFAENVNKIFFYYAFGQMSLCVLLFCTAMFVLSVVEPSSPQFYTVMVFIVTIGVQLFLYCWFGNEVVVQSSKLHLVAFHCNWVGAPISFQKRLMFFIMRTAKPIRIYALHFFPLSIATFTAIMRTSWSYFAVLNQVHDKE